MKKMYVLILLAFMSFTVKAQTDSSQAPTPGQQYQIAKAIGQSKQRMNDAGLMHIIGGSSLGIGAGALFYNLKRGGIESEYTMYSFTGIGIGLNITAGIMHIAAARKLGKNF